MCSVRMSGKYSNSAQDKKSQVITGTEDEGEADKDKNS